MIEILILFVLSKRDLTLYAISKHIREFFGFLTKTSLGTISPAVQRLADLQCINFATSSSEGGKPSKVCMITQDGEKYLKQLLLNFECDNPLYVLNYTKAVLMCSEILNDDEKEKCLHNLINILSLFSIDTQRKADDPYINYSPVQLKVIQLQKKHIDEYLFLLNTFSTKRV